MKFYEIINGVNFVGIGSALNFCRYQSKHNIILSCNVQEAQFIMFNEQLYHDNWMVSVKNVPVQYTQVEVIEISEEEYNELAEKIEQGQEIEMGIEEEIYIEEPIEESLTNQQIATLEFLKNQKLIEMNSKCNQIITSGFDTVLSDGENHHFSLTTQDQLNLITLSTQIAAGETQIPYHADDEMCRFFSVADIMTIIQKATEYKTYHVTYFNSLKAYIKSIDNANDVAMIEYGVEIPEEYCSDILKMMESHD